MSTESHSVLDEVSNPKRVARAFERTFSAASPTWPQQLRDLGEIAPLSLKMRDQPAFAQSEAMQRESTKDLQAFAAAYAEYSGGR